MSCYSGPEITNDGLVMYYDMNNTQKSWKGAPTTNLITLPFSSWANGYNTGITTNQLDPFGDYNATLLIDTDSVNNGSYIESNTTITPSLTTVYSLSLYVKKGTSSTVEVWGFFTGTTMAASVLQYTFSTNTIVLGVAEGPGITPFNAGSEKLSSDWVRIYFSVKDAFGTNNNICFRIYPTVRATGTTGTIYVYGAQCEINPFPTPYVSGSRTTSTALLDLSGNNNTLTATSLTYASDNTFSFNGTTQNITTTSVLVPAGATAYTVSVWYNRSRNNVIEELLSQWTTANSGNSFFFGFSSSNVRFTDSWNTISVTGAGTTGTWNNLVGVNSGTNAYIYLNGVLMATKGSALTYTGTGNFIIGNQSQFNAEYFQGSISNVQVYNIALTSDQVKQNFNAVRSRYGI